MKVAVLGAGISGLVCARRLQEMGHEVVVLEKSRSLGGRCASRKIGEHVVDTGAQYFTLRDGQVRQAVEKIAGDQLRKISLPILDRRTREVYREGEERFYLAEGNNRLGKYLAEGLQVRKEVELGPWEKAGGNWIVAGEKFGAVVCSAPWPQAKVLSGSHEEGVKYDPCLTAVVEYRVPWQEKGSFYAEMEPSGQDALAWVAWENAKEGRIVGENTVVVIQASIQYSRENLEKKPEEWVEDLQQKLEKQGRLEKKFRGQSMGHRWRYSRRQEGGRISATASQGIYFCGDSTTESRVESVWKSGWETAEKVSAKETTV